MKVITITETVAGLPFFRDLEPQYIELLAGCASHVHLEPDAFLLREREPATSFFLIRSGDVAIEISSGRHDALVIETLHANDIVGWSWLIPPFESRFDARAVTAVSAISFDGICLRNKCDVDPRFGYEILRRFTSVMVQRLTATRMQLIDVYQ